MGRFCERFILSLGDCRACVAMNDQLEVLPISSHIVQLEPVAPNTKTQLSENDEELAALKSKMADNKPIGPMIKLCKTLCQAKVGIPVCLLFPSNKHFRLFCACLIWSLSVL